MSQNQRVIADRYQLGELIGRGGMADVYEGVDTRLGRIVAIKLLKSDLANDPTFEARFRQEAQASARMAHPTIVRIYDAGEEELVDGNGNTVRRPYIVMEFVKGRVLRDILHERQLTLEESIEYANGVLTALETSHNAGIIHRDIKSANVMITDAGAVKVMDFGIARAISDSSSTQAHTSGIVGTAQYFSPEQARGENVDARTDLYSTGVLLYEMLAGQPPFRGETAVSVAYQHVSEAVTPPSKHNSKVTPSLDQVVIHSMAKDRNERFQSAAEFRDHLMAAASNLSAESVPQPLDPLAEFEALLRGSNESAADATAVMEQPAAAAAQPAEPVAPPAASADAPSTEEPATPPAGIEYVFEEPAATARSAEETQVLSNPFQELGVEFSPATTAIPVATGAVETNRARSGAPRPGLMWGVGSGLVVFVVGLLVWFFTAGSLSWQLNLQPSGVAVPNVVSQTIEQGSATLDAAELQVNLVYQVSDTVAPNIIISTDPVAGTQVNPNTTITVYVSSGQEQVEVPDLTGKSEADASAALTIAKLQLGTITPANSSSVPEGFVISSDPLFGTKLPAGSLINLTVSNGKVNVPDVRNLDVNVARSQLTSPEVGFTVSVTSREVCAGTLGTVVIDQSVAAGLAPQKSAIVLYVGCTQ